MSAVYNSTVQGFYLSYYGRPADPAGLTFWTGQLAAAGGNLSAILNAFGTSAEATRRFGTGDNASKINAIYQQTFGRAAEAGPTGLGFYEAELAAGRMTLIDVSKRIIDGATGDDAAVRTNRLSAAQSFTDKLDTDSEKAGYSGTGAEDAARSWIAAVTKDAATVTAAVSTADATITNLLPVTFSLTSSADTWTGGTGNDTVSGKNSNLGGTLQGTDKLDGGAGTDTLNLTTDVDFAGFTTGFAKNIENVNITNSGATSRAFDMTGVTGVTSLSIDATKGAVTITALPTGVSKVSLSGLSGETGATTFSTDYVAGATEISSTSTALAFDLTNVGTATTKRVTATLGSVETVNVTATGTNFFALGGTTATAMTVAGSGTVNTTGGTALTSFDGSTATGALTVDLSGVTAAGTLATFRTGSAGDTLTAAVEDLRANATIAAGAGTDTLNLSNAGTSAVTVAYNLSGVETLAIGQTATGGDLTIAGSNVDSALATVSIKGGATSATGAKVDLAGMGSRTLTLNVLGASADAADLSSDNTGTSTVNFKADGTAAKAGTGVDAPQGEVTLSQASSVTVNAEAYTDTSAVNPTVAAAADVVITASKATSFALNVASGKDTSGAEITEFGGRISAPAATSVTIAATGKLDSTIVSAPAATSVTVTNGDTAGTLRLDTTTGGTTTTKLTSLSITSGSAFTLLAAQNAAAADAALTKVQNLTLAANKGLVRILGQDGSTVSDLVALNTATLTGSGTGSAVLLGAVGQTSNAYDMTITATGTLRGTTSVDGLKVGAITVTKGNNVTVDAQAVTGSVNLGTIGVAANAGNVTIKAGGAGTFTGLTAGFTVGQIAADGAIDINSSGARSTSIASGSTIVGNTVKIDMSNNTNAAYSLGTITAKTSLDLTLNQLGEAKMITVNAASDSTGLSVAVKGGVLQEDLVVVATGANVAAITLTGDLSAGSDTVTIDGTGSKAKTISLAGLADYTSSDIRTSTAADTVIGGAGADVIKTAGGADSLTGGAGADRFVISKGHSPHTAPVTIVDLGSTDTITYGTADPIVGISTGSTTVAAPSSGAAGAGGVVDAGGTVAVSAARVATFTGTASGYDSLAKKVGLLSVAAGATDGAYALFSHGGTTYMFLGGGTDTVVSDDSVIILTGIALPNTAATIATGASSGLIGLGA